MASSSEAVKSAQPERTSPIVLDFGKHKKKSVKQLRQGRGRLLDDALDSIEEMQRVGTIPHTAQPVILIVREKSRTSKMFPFMGR